MHALKVSLNTHYIFCIQTKNKITLNTRKQHIVHQSHLCDKLNSATSILDLPLSLLAEIPRSNNDGDLWESTLAKHFGVAEREEVEDGDGISLLVVHVCVAGFSGDERP